MDGEVSIDSNVYQQIGFYGYKWVENTFSGGCQEPPMHFDGTVGRSSLFAQEMKKKYKKPEVKKVTIDNEISMVMMSAFGPGSDPEASVIKKLNPLRWWR